MAERKTSSFTPTYHLKEIPDVTTETTGRTANSQNHLPMLAIRDAAGAIEFYKKAFAATRAFFDLIPMANEVVHTEVADRRGGIVMLAEERPGPQRSAQRRWAIRP